MERKINDPKLSNLLICGDFIGKIWIYDLTEFNLIA